MRLAHLIDRRPQAGELGYEHARARAHRNVPRRAGDELNRLELGRTDRHEIAGDVRLDRPAIGRSEHLVVVDDIHLHPVRRVYDDVDIRAFYYD